MNKFLILNFLLLSIILPIKPFYFRYKSNCNSLINIHNNINIDSNKIYEDFIIKIFSRIGNIYEGIVLLLNYEIDHINYIKKSTPNSTFSNLINENKFSQVFDLIKSFNLKETNFLVNDYKEYNNYYNYLNNKDEIYKIGDYYILKIKFQENKLLEIYKPEEFELNDFIYLIQDINKSFLINKDNINSYFIYNDNKQCFNINYNILLKNYNVLYKSYKEKNENDNIEKDDKFSFKQYLVDIMNNKHLNMILFSRIYFGFGTEGKAYIDIIDSNISLFTIKIFYNIQGTKPFEIFSKEMIFKTNKLKEFLEYFGEKVDYFKDKMNFFLKINKKDIEIMINSFLNLILSFDYKDFFSDPVKYIIEILIVFKNLSLNFLTYIFSFITKIIIDNYSKLRELINPLFNQIIKILEQNNHFFNIDQLKSFFNSGFSFIKDSSRNIYDKVAESKYGKFIKSESEKIKEKSKKVIEKGYETIKEVTSSETAQNIYKKVGDSISKENIKNIGNKIISNTMEIKDNEQVNNFYNKIGNIFSKENINNIGNKIKSGIDIVKDKSGEFINKNDDKIKDTKESEKPKDIFDKIGNIFK